MKIEKLTEDKIRIIIHQEELKNKDMDLHTIMSRAANSEGIFRELLELAQKEVDFNTDGCRLMLEAFSSPDGIYVFTITKYLVENSNLNNYTKSNTKLRVRRKHIPLEATKSIHKFSTFDDFCTFCTFLKKTQNLSLKGLVKDASLYTYKDFYYLLLNKLNTKHKNFKKFMHCLCEFGKPVSHSVEFESKIKEHGDVVIKSRAIYTGIKYFSNI